MTSLFEHARDRIDQDRLKESRLEPLEAIVQSSPVGVQTQLRQHLELCPKSYLLETDSVVALEELSLIQRVPHDGFAIKLRPDQQVLRITMASKNWGNRFVHQTGVLSALALSIHGATTWTRMDGIGMDRFVVADFKDRPPELLKGQIFEILHRCRQGQIDISKMVADSSRAFRRSELDPQLEPPLGRSRYDNELSAEYTVVEVSTKDRLGLLYAMLRTFRQHNLTVHFSKI